MGTLENMAADAFDDLPRGKMAAIESLTRVIGREIFANLEETQPAVWERRDRHEGTTRHSQASKVLASWNEEYC